MFPFRKHVNSSHFVDLYEGNSAYNAPVYCAKHPFLVHKASQGLHHVDRLHGERCVHTHAQGKAVGHYHFAEAHGDPVREAHFFWGAVKPHFLTVWHHLPVAQAHLRTDFLILDLETPQPDWRGYARAFDETIAHIAGRLIILYASLSAVREHNLGCLSKKLWVAAYPGPVPKRFSNGCETWAHQFSDRGSVPGIGQSCDVSELIGVGSREYWGVK